MHKILKLIALAIMTLAVSPTFAQTHLDFSGWDEGILSTDGGSQMFENVCDGIDVTVTAAGEFAAPTTYLATMAGGVDTIRSAIEPDTMQSYTFTFSEPISIDLETYSLDGAEKYTIESNGTQTYTNLTGAAPLLSSTGDGFTIEGVGFGQDAVSGAADGRTFIDGATSITVTYMADPGDFTKFGAFNLFKPVPEPSSAVLLLIGGLTMCRRRRK